MKIITIIINKPERDPQIAITVIITAMTIFFFFFEYYYQTWSRVDLKYQKKIVKNSPQKIKIGEKNGPNRTEMDARRRRRRLTFHSTLGNL